MSAGPLEIRIDGRPVLEVGPVAGWPLDRGLHYGDGLFETMVVRDGRVRFAALHRDRLDRGLQRLQIRLDQQVAWREVDAVAARHGHGLLKLLITRGDATQRGYGAAGDELPRRVLLAYAPSPQLQPVTAGEGAVCLTSTLGENPALAGLKHTNRLEQVLARIEMAAKGAFEGLLASSSGLLVSGTMSNVYVRFQGQWQTPRVDRCGIAGVMRAVVLREAARAKLPLQEREIRYADLAACEALCISNVRLGLRPLQWLEGRTLARDAAMQSLARRLELLDD